MAAKWWMVIGMALMTLELVVPGVVLVFFGAGAIMTGLVTLMFPSFPMYAQTLLFTIFSVVSLVVCRRFIVGRGKGQTARQDVDYDDDFTGRMATVVEAIPAGAPGKAELNGANWNAVSDVPVAVGARVRVVSRDGLTLHVEPVA